MDLIQTWREDDLLPHRRPVAQTPAPRFLGDLGDASVLNRFEVALLAPGLLCHMAVECPLLAANIDGTESALCIWRHQGNWYPLPVWEAQRVQIENGPTGMRSWSEQPQPERMSPAGGEVIKSYETITKRTLPIVLSARKLSD